MTSAHSCRTTDSEQHAPLVQLVSSGIPAELTVLDQWVVWKLDLRNGKSTKVPYNPHTGQRASVNNPSTWSAFDLALRCLAVPGSGFAGLGFVFSDADPYFGVDLDACRDPATGELTDWAQEILDRFPTYGEISPSATGVKLIGRGALPADGRRVFKPSGVPSFGDKNPEIAVYDRARYWCITGQRVDGMPQACEVCQDGLDWLQSTYLRARSAARRTAPSSTSSLQPANAHGDAQFDRLVAASAAAEIGQRSEHDYALCAYAVRRQLDPEGVWRRVMTVGKFAERGREYFDRTWANAEAAVGSTAPLSGALGLLSSKGQTDIANARRLFALHGQDILYCDSWKKFLHWDGKRWSIDTQRRIEALAKDVSDQIWRAISTVGSGLDAHLLGQLIRFARRSSDAPGIARMVQMLASEPGIAILPEQLTPRSSLINCPNGTIDLVTGSLRTHSRDNMIMQLCPTNYSADATCPLWRRAIDSIFGGDPELVGFVHRLLGYCLTGTVTEHILPIFCGGGSNGKSLLVETLLEVLGPDYAAKAAPGLLLARRNEGHPTEVADLFGKRLVVASETDRDGKLSEAQVKQLTGGDKIKARRMREDYWEFVPSHTILLVTNYMPVVRGTDNGIWRRLTVVPFTQVFWNQSRGECGPPELEAIPDLREQLRQEHAGILRWLVEGCLAWQEHGLNPPTTVTTATGNYRAREDTVAQFLETACTFGPGLTVKASIVREAYEVWCASIGERPVSGRVFGAAITERGVTRRNSNGTWYDGISLRST